MSDRSDVLAASRRRSQALVESDAETLTRLLHPEFGWVSHTGATYSREEYVRRNTDGTTRWRSQDLMEATVVVAGDTGVLRARAIDVVESGRGARRFVMPVSMTWVRVDEAWLLLAGHAGPLEAAPK